MHPMTAQKDISKTFPQHEVDKQWKNLGFGRANNLGAKCASGKYLFF